MTIFKIIESGFRLHYPLASIVWLFPIAAMCQAQTPSGWLIHDLQRPQPPVVTPAKQDLPVPAPDDARVLFDGTDLRQWRSADGTEPRWMIREDYMESVPNSGYLVSAESFGDVQLHLEWAAPSVPKGKGQERGNSGVFLMGKYELQILDSYESRTYPDGQAAAIYGQYPPLVNACLPPGDWQSYDLVFRRPHFDSQGKVVSPARLTVLHNGMLVHEGRDLFGPTSWLKHHPYTPHADRLPLALQDHGNPVRFRNIWLRELNFDARDAPKNRAKRNVFPIQLEILNRFVGNYVQDDGTPTDVLRDGDVLWLQILGRERLELVPAATDTFFLRETDGKVVFQIDAPDIGAPEVSQPVDREVNLKQVPHLTLHLGGRTYRAVRTATPNLKP